MKTLITLATLAMAMTGSAFAGGALDAWMDEHKSTMASFYTDEGMTSMKSGDDFMKAVSGMKESERSELAAACKNAQNTMHENFCTAFGDAINKM